MFVLALSTNLILSLISEPDSPNQSNSDLSGVVHHRFFNPIGIKKHKEFNIKVKLTTPLYWPISNVYQKHIYADYFKSLAFIKYIWLFWLQNDFAKPQDWKLQSKTIWLILQPLSIHNIVSPVTLSRDI